MPSRRDLLRALAAAGVVAVSQRGRAAAQEARYLTWPGYGLSELQTHYRAKYGADPVISTFLNAGDGFEGLRGGLVCDVIHPCAEDVSAWREAGLLQPIDVRRLRHWNKLHPRLRNVAPGPQYLVPWEWGEISIVYRTDVVKLPPRGESWTLLWDERYRGRIAMPHSATDGWCAAALAGGLAADTEHATLLGLVERLADNVGKVFSNPATLQRDLASGRIVAAVTWAGAVREAARAGLPVRFARPREGTLLWTCGLVLARNAPHLDKAYDLIDGMLAQDIGALCIERFRYGHSNIESFASVSDAALAAAALPRDPSPLLYAGLLRVDPPAAVRADLARVWTALALEKGEDDIGGPCACAGPKGLGAAALRAGRIPGAPPTI